jgi:hypothetical protein
LTCFFSERFGVERKDVKAFLPIDQIEIPIREIVEAEIEIDIPIREIVEAEIEIDIPIREQLEIPIRPIPFNIRPIEIACFFFSHEEIIFNNMNMSSSNWITGLLTVCISIEGFTVNHSITA